MTVFVVLRVNSVSWYGAPPLGHIGSVVLGSAVGIILRSCTCTQGPLLLYAGAQAMVEGLDSGSPRMGSHVLSLLCQCSGCGKRWDVGMAGSRFFGCSQDGDVADEALGLTQEARERAVMKRSSGVPACPGRVICSQA